MPGPRTGYPLPARDRAALGDHEATPLIRQARRAEELGSDSVWAGGSPMTRPPGDAAASPSAIVRSAWTARTT